MRKILFLCLTSIILSLLGLYFVIFQWPYNQKEQMFTIESGEYFSKVNYRLKQSNIIPSSTLLYRYAQYQNVMNKIQQGTFRIPEGSTMKNVLDILIYGRPIFITVTIPEGQNMYEVADILEKNDITTKSDFLTLAADQHFLQLLNIQQKTVEGLLFPDTYNFFPQMKANEVIKMMVNEFFKKTEKIFASLSREKQLETLILASIVEKETGRSHERGRIAGVFINRLKKSMRLQSDPTTIYGLFPQFSGNLIKKNLLDEQNPYNTYKITGLPPGPICSPGLAAISAVLNPEEHDYYYFVSRNDGTHQFSKNYSDHVNAVNQYQKRKR